VFALGPEWLQGTRQHRSYHFNHCDSTNQIPNRLAMRILKSVRVDPIPNLALEKPAGHQRLFPNRIRGKTVLRQEISGRSSIRSIAPRIVEKFVDSHDRVTCRWLAAHRDRRLIQP
jgi:hypothetical protein